MKLRKAIASGFRLRQPARLTCEYISSPCLIHSRIRIEQVVYGCRISGGNALQYRPVPGFDDPGDELERSEGILFFPGEQENGNIALGACPCGRAGRVCQGLIQPGLPGDDRLRARGGKEGILSSSSSSSSKSSSSLKYSLTLRAAATMCLQKWFSAYGQSQLKYS